MDDSDILFGFMDLCRGYHFVNEKLDFTLVLLEQRNIACYIGTIHKQGHYGSLQDLIQELRNGKALFNRHMDF